LTETPKLGFRLSSQQRRAWSLWQEGPSARTWCALLLEGVLDAERLRRAAETLAASHEILRTTFHRRSGMRTPVQVVGERGVVSWSAGENSPSVPAAVEKLVRQESASPRNLEKEPVFRLRLTAVSDSKHVLLFALPALCADRRTLHNIAGQLASLYGGSVARGPAAEPIQYADYAQWQSDLLESADEAGEAGRTESARLARRRAGAALEIPAKLPFETLRGDSGDSPRVHFALDPETVARIEAFGAATGSAAPDFLLAAWQVLLWRTTGEAERLVRAVHEGRHLDDLTDALGRFAVTLPMPLRFEQDRPFSEVVRLVAEARRESEERGDSFERTEESQAPADRTESIGFEFVERPQLPSGHGVSFSILEDFAPADAFALWLEVVREGSGIRIVCGIDPERLASAAAQRLAGHLKILIAAAAENPRRPAGELPVLTDVERRRLIVDLNRTDADFPRSRCIHELFEEQVERRPDAPALAFEQVRLTYRELNRQSNLLAWQLRRRGVGPDVPVGLCIERSAEMIIAILAVLKAGGAYVPLIPDHPSPRLSLQLERSGCRLVITQSKWIERLADFPAEKICLGRQPEGSNEGDESNPPWTAGPSHLVYIMHTSGSTGEPKGVAVRHENLVNYSHFASRTLFGIDPVSGSEMTFASVSTIGADLGHTAIFPSLISGGCLHVVPFESAMEGPLFADYLARNPIDVLKIVPSHFAALLASGGPGVIPRRSLVLGGEALSWDLVERLQSAGALCEIVNHYGPTETTVGSLTYRLSPGERRGPSRFVPIGRPIANTQAFVLDAAGQPVPLGVAGELHIGGAGVAAGYVGRPDETADRFVTPLFAEGVGGRLYRTGDRVRHLADGNLEFLGRVDDQVKIRGFRIEPGEVRGVLETHPGVRECIVLASEDSSGDRRLVAYVVPAAPVSNEDLRQWLKARLPDYMVPSAFVALKSLPLTANGKVDRNALPAPEKSAAERPYLPPRTASEQTVADTWKEVLRLERIGAEDNFFDLGGHSLLLTQVVSRLRKVFKRELPIRWFFEVPTVAGLAGRIDAAEREDLARMLDELEPLPAEVPEDRESAR